MRETYHARLDELTVHLADMCTTVGEAMRDATAALLHADRATAERVIAEDSIVDRQRSTVEDDAYALLALQAPVASELRAVLAAIHAAESLERMGDLAHHVAKAARRRHPDTTVPEPVRPLFERMGQLAVAQADSAAQVIRLRDTDLARKVEDADDDMDALHRELFGALLAKEWEHGVGAAVDVAQLGRFYERFADHAVSVVRRIAFVVTGQPNRPVT